MRGTGCLRHRLNRSCQDIDRKEKRTNVSGNPSEDDLTLPCVTNGFSEFGIIPSVDLTIASN